MLYEELQKRKKELKLTTEQLSTLSGIPIGTINKILSGETRSPRYDTITALKKALQWDGNTSFQELHDPGIAYVRNRQGDYTLEDYRNLPDDTRAELIDGTLYAMSSPSFEHQELLMSLGFELKSFIASKKGACKVLPAPLDVQLDRDDKTVVQPDIVVSCSPEHRNKKGMIGAPDFCIEITSASTSKRDYGLKMVKYMNAGVREYWIVDPAREMITCYYFEQEDFPHLFSFEDAVPVRIFDEQLKIDMKSIKETLG